MDTIPELRQEASLEDDTPARRQAHAADAASPRRKPLQILTLIVIVAAIAGFAFWLSSRGYQTTDDAEIDGHLVQISPRVSAQVTRLYVDDNQEVRKGELLIELDPRDFQVALEKAQAQLLQARAQAQQVRAQALQAQAQVTQAEAQLAQQSAQYDIASINFNRNSSLYQQDARAVSKEDVDTTKTGLDSAAGIVGAARANVAAARAAAQAVAAQIGSADAAVHVAEAAVDDATLQLSYTRITAPEDGAVTRRTVEAGNYVTAGQTLFSIVRHDVWVTADFKENQLARMHPGQPVRIRVDAFPGRDFKAHVDSIQLGSGSRFSLLPAENATGNYVKVVQRIPVKIVFDEPPSALLRLAPGMSVDPRVNVAAQGSLPAQ